MKFQIGPSVVGCALALTLAACSKPADPSTHAAAVSGASAPAAASVGSANAAFAAASLGSAGAALVAAAPVKGGIDWRHASSDAEVEAAFVEARAAAKPVFLYWGASWCPPCNKVKATLFNRQDFIERSRAFVAVYVDGDMPGAQKVGAHFHVSGYPTMLLFSADGTELTRLPGEVEPVRYSEVLTLAMNAGRPVKAMLADALAGGRGLGTNDWRLLAFYSWDSDEQQLVPKGEVPATLKRLAAACPAAEVDSATRLWLRSLAALDAKGTTAAAPAALERVIGVLADEKAARAQFDVLADYAPEITRALSARGTPARAGLVERYDWALARFEGDATLARIDRLGALIARVGLARIEVPTADVAAVRSTPAPRPRLAPELLADVREQVARIDRETTDGYERQVVVNSAAYLLVQAGLMENSDALLKANLATSPSPYYLMTGLAENAASRGDRTDALRWHREAYATSEGPATRLQWGARYIVAMTKLAPGDEAQIGRTVAQFLAEAAAQPNAFYERSAASVRRVGKALRAWNQGGAHAGALRRFETQLGAICKRFDGADAQRQTCRNALKAEPKAA